MLRFRGFGVAGVAVFDLIRDVVEFGVVLACLQQQHRPVRVLGQPAGQDRPGCSAANDDYVVLHGSSLYFHPIFIPGGN